MLHIVNGDSVGDKLKQGAVEGEVLVWREIFTEGPVHPEPAVPANRSFRAAALERTMGIPSADYIAGCEAQERRLQRFRDDDAVVLWFEYDLFDQTILWHLLDRFARQDRGSTELYLLSIDSFPGIPDFRGFGQLSAEQLRSLAGTRVPIGERQLALGQAYWRAYTADDPREMSRLIRQDTADLPFAREALRFHLTRFPSDRNGLGIVEQTALELILSGFHQPEALFRETGSRLRRFGMGDLQFRACLRQLAEEPDPLIRIEGADAPFPTFADPSQDFLRCRITLTSAGRRVLNGEADRIDVNSIDQWLGGVRLQGRTNVWRWNGVELIRR